MKTHKKSRGSREPKSGGKSEKRVEQGGDLGVRG